MLARHSDLSDVDPCLEIPAAFVDPTRIPKMVRELKKVATAEDEVIGDGDAPEAAAAARRAEAGYHPTVHQIFSLIPIVHHRPKN